MAGVEATILNLSRAWKIGARIGGGGYGRVYEASGPDGELAAVKCVAKAPGARREMLFADDLSRARNVVPVIDSGETEDAWVLVMPRAEQSLREHLERSASLGMADALEVLRDVAEALADLDGRVVHRDLKPENVLLLDGRWCLADFGISRYAEATTAPDTRKSAMTKEYAAPEQWRQERASSATDVYSLGIMAYEMLAGQRPFPGPEASDFREQHLHADAPTLTSVPAALGSLISECLYKPKEARPKAANILLRLDKIALQAQATSGLARLQEANRAEVLRRSEAARRASEAQTERERRDAIAAAGRQALDAIMSELMQSIEDAAPSVEKADVQKGGWTLRLSKARLRFVPMAQFDGPLSAGAGAIRSPIDVIAYASLELTNPVFGYMGRSHSLWYCDAQEEGRYQWFETAFMTLPFMLKYLLDLEQTPFAMPPGEAAAKALRTIAGHQVAWPFMPLTPGELDEFVDRWAEWFALAAEGQLHRPSQMPERPPEGSFRR